MCAIAGHVTPASMPDAALVEAMAAAQRARGPDDSGLVVRPHCALGHRRLAIVDLAGGHQPLANEDGSVWIAYNGEVYNHASLRHDLESRGHTFRTRSDTEAIVHAYEEHGPRCATRLRGMFAFAVWDGARRRLLLVRDRLGIKPLYYAALPGGGLLFASDLKALLRSPEVDRTLDEEALACYLALRYVPAPRTLLRGVRKLPPGSLLRWEITSGGAVRLSTERWWDVRDTVLLDDAPPTEAEEAARLRELCDECVSLRLMSEVPLGAFLSGGLDSTAVVAAMRAAQPGSDPPCTFAVGYQDQPADSELPWAALAATRLGTRHIEALVDGPVAAEALPRIAADLDEPVGDPAAVPLWFLARRAREQVTVVLSGEGADEIFGGYAIYRWMAVMERLRAGPLGGALSLASGLVAPVLRGRAGRAAAALSQPLEARYRGVSRAFDGPGRALLLGGGGAAAADRALQSTLEPLWEATRGLSPLRRMLYLDLAAWLPEDLLVKADKTTMAASIELRVPLLDHKLVEHAWSLPDAMKIHGSEGKRIFRRAMRGRVPRAIMTRPKRGFSTPSRGWLRGAMAPLLAEALLATGSLARARTSRPYVDRLLAEHAAGRADRSPELWTLLSLELWKRAVDGVEHHEDGAARAASAG